MIKLSNLVASYTTARGQVEALDGINLQIPSGHIVGIAGESGCGKTTLLRVLYGDISPPLSLKKGNVQYGFCDVNGKEVTSDNIRDYWFKRISYIPQSSMNALNPVIRIRKQFTDFLDSKEGKAEILKEVRVYAKNLDLPPEAIDAYPHELSGGMKQRIIIAMATFLQPDILLADEPTTALDVVVQKGILLMLKRLQKQMQNTIILVSHDMGVHYQIVHKMVIMYAAKVVEFGDSAAVFEAPLHPYTKMLIESLPTIGDDRVRRSVRGRPPSLWEDLKGCRFAPRCPMATERCKSKEPALREYKPGRFVACHYVEKSLQ